MAVDRPPSYQQQILTKDVFDNKKLSMHAFSLFKRENESITVSDRQTFVINNIKFVSVRTVVDHKISLKAENHR